MIAPPSGVRMWLANDHTDMRRGMNGLALQSSRRFSAIYMQATSTCSGDAAVIC